MKNIIWIDKDLQNIKEHYSASFERIDVTIHEFSDYKASFDFLKNISLPIDYIISNYCLFSWEQCLENPSLQFDEEKICFKFFMNVLSKFPNIPIILFSSFNIKDYRIELFEELGSFNCISKKDPKALSKIKEMVFSENSVSTKTRLDLSIES